MAMDFLIKAIKMSMSILIVDIRWANTFKANSTLSCSIVKVECRACEIPTSPHEILQSESIYRCEYALYIWTHRPSANAALF